MSVFQERPTIVIPGHWNPAILQPDWLASNVFDKADDENLQVDMEFSPVPGFPPRFTLRGITLIPSASRLIILAKDHSDEELIAAEKIAVKLLANLPHTPIRGIGLNFRFTTELPSPELLGFFEVDNALNDYLGIEYSLAKTEIKSSLEFDGLILNFSRAFEKGNVSLLFNFHFPVSNSVEAKSAIENTFVKYFALVQQILINFNTPITDDLESISNEYPSA